MDIKLGDSVEDTVSGFKGTVTSICLYLHSTPRVAITPKVSAKIKSPSQEWFEIGSVKVVKAKTAIKKKQKATK